MTNNEKQEQRVQNIYQQLLELCKEANMRDYEPTEKERITFGQIVTLVDSMNNWF